MKHKSAEQIMKEAIDKANADIAKAKIEGEIVESLPVEPKLIHVYTLYKSIGSASYRVKTKQEAYDIYKMFLDTGNVLPSFICRDGTFTSIKCFDDEKAKEVSQVHAIVKMDQWHADLEFFTNTKAGIIRVSIEMPLHIFGGYLKDSPSKVKHYKLIWSPLPKTNEMFLAIRYGAANLTGEYSANQIVYALYDKFEMENQFTGNQK